MHFIGKLLTLTIYLLCRIEQSLPLPSIRKLSVSDFQILNGIMSTKWGIVSAGKISNDFVTAVRSIGNEDHEIVAVAARSLASSKEFASIHGIKQAYGAYGDLAKDPNVEVVYIGTVNNHHFSIGKLMLESGKHVLMEKPMTLSLKQTKELIAIAKKHQRFLMEAVWSRFFPAYKCMTDLINKGIIGDIVHVNVCFGFNLIHVDRLIKNELGGGTILDLGIYTINAVTMLYGGEMPEKISAVGHLNNEGVDISMSTSLQYTNNRTASISCNALAELQNELMINGTKGWIKVLNPFWCPTVVVTADKTYEFPLPDTIRPCNFVNSSGLRFEAMEVRDCITKGKLESEIMPLKDSETMAAIMDEIRRQIGVKYRDD